MFPHSFSLNLLPLPSSGRTGLMVSWGSRFFPSSNFDAAPQPSVTSEMSVPLSVRCGMGDDSSPGAHPKVVTWRDDESVSVSSPDRGSGEHSGRSVAA